VFPSTIIIINTRSDGYVNDCGSPSMKHAASRSKDTCIDRIEEGGLVYRIFFLLACHFVAA